MMHDHNAQLEIIMGNPGVFQGYPDPNLVKTHTWSQGMGFTGYRYGYLSGCIDIGQVRQYGPGQAGIWQIRYELHTCVIEITV
jgi:hypothetical protein